MTKPHRPAQVALIEAGSPGLNIYSHIAMGRGLPILATVLDEAGVKVRAFIEDVSGKDSIDWEYVSGADVVGFSAITCTLTRTAELVERAKRVNPNGIIVLGGPEPTCLPQRSLHAGADFVIKGEAEQSLLRFVDAVRRVKATATTRTDLIDEVRDIPGIAWLEDGSLRFGPPHRQLTRGEIDALPFIDGSLIHRHHNEVTAVIWRSRGCPHRCEFCEVHEIWPRHVLRDEDRSIEELMCLQAHDPEGVFLIDDNCAANKPSFKRFLRGALERGFNRPLTVQMRADAALDSTGKVDHELLRLLKEVAPYTVVCVGIESSSDEDLNQIGKRETAGATAKALKAMRRYGLLVHGMLIAFANDAADTIARNGAYARKHVSSLQLLFETPLPGTKRTAQHESAGRIIWRELDHLRFLDGMHIALWPEHMTPQEMHRLVVREYRRFYSRARLAGAFVAGLVFRHRRLSPAMRDRLATFRGWQRSKQWALMHVQYKFAPWGLLRIGRRRVLELLRDANHLEHLRLLESMTGPHARADRTNSQPGSTIDRRGDGGRESAALKAS